jgi:hypothetical protein
MIQTRDGSYWEPVTLAEGQENLAATVSAYPAGGGMQVSIPKEDVIDWDAKFPENKWRYVWVGFDGDAVCKAYLGPKRWNGFEIPFVDRENLLRFIAYQDAYSKEAFDVTTGRINASGHFEVSDDNGGYVLVPSTKIQFEGKEVEVWDIGFGLVWDEWEEETYKEHVIVDKRDFGRHPHLVNGKYVKTGFVVTYKGANIMPGAVWFQSVAEAKTAIDILLEHGEKGFWNAFRGTHS